MSQVIVFIITVLTIILCLTANILYKRLGWFKWFFHNRLNWHEPAEADSLDFDIENSCFVTTCKYCGKEIISSNFIDWNEKE